MRDEPSPSISISKVRFRPIRDGRDGLVGWASCLLDDCLQLNNIAVRRGRGGSLYLTFPAKQLASGSRRHYFHPINREAAAALEDAILGRMQSLLTADPSQPGGRS